MQRRAKIIPRWVPRSKTVTDSSRDWLVIKTKKMKRKNAFPLMKAYIAAPAQVVSDSSAMMGWQTKVGSAKSQRFLIVAANLPSCVSE